MSRGLLAILAAITLAAVMILPVTGYTINSETSPYPFSIGAEDRPGFSIGAGEPAHEITPESLGSDRSAVYSISMGKPYQYTLTVTPEIYSFDLATSALYTTEG